MVLPRKIGNIGINSPIETANEEYVNSRELTKKLTNAIIQQEHNYTVSEDETKNKILSSLRDKMSYMEIR